MEIASWFFLRKWQHSKRIERCPSGEKKNESINRYLSPNDRKYSEKSELNSVRLRVWSTWKHVDNRFSDVFFASQNRSIRDGLRPKYPKKNKKKQTSDDKKTTHSWKARQGFIKRVCKISGTFSRKRRGHWTLKELGVLCLNQRIRSLYMRMKLTERAKILGAKLTTCKCQELHAPR